MIKTSRDFIFYMNVEHESCTMEKEGEQPEQPKKIVLGSIGEYIKKQIEESRRDYNKWFTGEEVGHDPSQEEMFKHYVDYGGAEKFAARYTYVEACTQEEKEQ